MDQNIVAITRARNVTTMVTNVACRLHAVLRSVHVIFVNYMMVKPVKEGKKMKRFETPVLEIQRLAPEDVFTTSCTVEALGCDSCYCIGVVCDEYSCNHQCPGCYDDLDS